jgi:hypothetical protein
VDRFFTLAQLGQHSQACKQRAQSIAVTLLLRHAPQDLVQVEAEIDELAADYGALVATLRAHLGTRRAEVEAQLEHAA